MPVPKRYDIDQIHSNSIPSAHLCKPSFSQKHFRFKFYIKMGFPKQGMIFYENLSTKNNAAAHHTTDIMHSAITILEEYMVSSLNGTYHILGSFALVCTDGIYKHHVMLATSNNRLNMTVSLNNFNSSVSVSYHNDCVFRPREL